MTARDRAQEHRGTSPLELLFDLVFVVAVSQASATLHDLLREGHVGPGVLGYLMVFFAVWWAWVNFTWFASAFDTDDWLYRVMTIVQMGGVLLLAAGVHDAMVSYDFTIVTWGYVVMRLSMVGQWVRAAVSDPASRRTALAFAIGITVVQVLWVARIYLLDATGQFITFFVLMAAEFAVPAIAERQGATAWHPDHIADRYGCFTLIVLGESVLAVATAVFAALRGGSHVGVLVAVAAAGLAIVAAMWWFYFARVEGDVLADARSGFVFGYAHYVVFAAAGAVSVGLQSLIDLDLGQTALTAGGVTLTLVIPIAVFAVTVWVLTTRPRGPVSR